MRSKNGWCFSSAGEASFHLSFSAAQEAACDLTQVKAAQEENHTSEGEVGPRLPMVWNVLPPCMIPAGREAMLRRSMPSGQLRSSWVVSWLILLIPVTAHPAAATAGSQLMPTGKLPQR